MRGRGRGLEAGVGALHNMGGKEYSWNITNCMQLCLVFQYAIVLSKTHTKLFGKNFVVKGPHYR